MDTHERSFVCPPFPLSRLEVTGQVLGPHSSVFKSMLEVLKLTCQNFSGRVLFCSITNRTILYVLFSIKNKKKFSLHSNLPKDIEAK